MKLGIMQPYFFPYIGYFDLINRTDRWVVFDVVKYKPKSWMSRNRILHPSDGWQYVSVPVDKHCEDGLIKDVRVVEKERARQKIQGQMQHYRTGRAPYYTKVAELIDRTFAVPGDALRDLNEASLRVTCEYLGIPFDSAVLSALGLQLGSITHAGQWAVEISAALGADEYINPPGGTDIFRPEEFQARGITLDFTHVLDYRYACGAYAFVERLSILDVLMWNAPADVKAYLDGLR